MADIIVPIADDLHGGNRAITVFQLDIEPLFGEPALFYGEMEWRLIAPRGPVKADAQRVGCIGET